MRKKTEQEIEIEIEIENGFIIMLYLHAPKFIQKRLMKKFCIWETSALYYHYLHQKTSNRDTYKMRQLGMGV